MNDRDTKIHLAGSTGIGDGAETSPESASEPSEAGKLATELDDMRQTLLRRQADFDNYRKRTERERLDDSKRATSRVIEALIPILDSFEQALAAHREAEYESYRKGFELIYKQLLENITKLGAERVDPLGKPFDPHLHQAVDRAETTEEKDGTILSVFQPGYVFNGRVLRPAMVRVAVHPNPASNRMAN